MAKRYFNSTEAGMNAGLDPRTERIPDSMISRSPEQAMQAEIELLADGFAQKDKKMQQMILHDLHLAQQGTADQAKEARQRLARAGISSSWPTEVLGVIESRLKDASMQTKGPDYNTDPRYKAFRDLFKKDTGLN